MVGNRSDGAGLVQHLDTFEQWQVLIERLTVILIDSGYRRRNLEREMMHRWRWMVERVRCHRHRGFVVVPERRVVAGRTLGWFC